MSDDELAPALSAEHWAWMSPVASVSCDARGMHFSRLREPGVPGARSLSVDPVTEPAAAIAGLNAMLDDGDRRKITHATVGRIREIVYDVRTNLELNYGPRAKWRADSPPAHWGRILDALEQDARALASLLPPREG